MGKERHPLKIDRSLFVDAARFVRFERALKRELPRYSERRRVCFTPDLPPPWYFARAIVSQWGAVATTSPSEADIIWSFDDATCTEGIDGSLNPGAVFLNNYCRDVSKSHVAKCFAEIFGYDLAVDPCEHEGPIVEKSEQNGAHDGRVVIGPTMAQPGRVYQRLVDNQVSGGLVEDLRTTIMGGWPVLVFRKRRSVAARFMNFNRHVCFQLASDVFTPEEISLLGRLCKRLGLDAGALDVLRDRRSGQLFVVDANKTDMGPPLALPLKEQIASTRIMAAALECFFRGDALQGFLVPSSW